MIDKRCYQLNNRQYSGGGVVLWMQREQRVMDNWALIRAYDAAVANGTFLCAVFCLADGFTNANGSHYSFMLDGLKQVSRDLDKLNIPFYILRGNPAEEISRFVSATGAGLVFTDFFPVRIAMRWKEQTAALLNVPLIEVDSHNIVPCRAASPKKEYSAATFRPKIKRVLSDYLTEFPEIRPFENNRPPVPIEISVEEAAKKFSADVCPPVLSGESAAGKALADFINLRLEGYSANRNDPNKDAQSHLSPYFHFGQLSPQRAALDVMAAGAPQEDKDAFLEELIVRRELSDNYCFYNDKYDSVYGADSWALKTIEEHRADRREYIYDYDVLSLGKTHDSLWNAAQSELVHNGRMHGYMRMYWAKKILEWSPDAETAFNHALLLNDTYALDGRDPNGYVGVAWSVAGVHDRAWPQRPVFGKIRYMNFNGCKSKFDVAAYIEKQKRLA